MPPKINSAVFCHDGFIYVFDCAAVNAPPRTLAVIQRPVQFHIHDNQLYSQAPNAELLPLLLNEPVPDATAMLKDIKQAESRVRWSVFRRYLKLAVLFTLLTTGLMLIGGRSHHSSHDYSPCHMDCLGGLD